MGDGTESQPTAGLPHSLRVPAPSRGAEGREREDRAAPGAPTRGHQPSNYPPTPEGCSTAEDGPGQFLPWQPTRSEHMLNY